MEQAGRSEDTGICPCDMLEAQCWHSPIWILPLLHMSLMTMDR